MDEPSCVGSGVKIPIAGLGKGWGISVCMDAYIGWPYKRL